MPAAWAGVAVAAGSAIAGAVGSSGAVDSGASAANALSQQAIDKGTSYYQPYMDAGTGALKQQNDLLGLNGADAAAGAMGTFQASPGYQYQVQQGLRGVDAGAAASGMLRSGATLKAEQTLGNNLANQDFGNYYNRLTGLSTQGLQATQGTVNLLSGQSTGQQNTLTSAAGNDASIFGNTAQGLQNAAGLANKNGLFGTTGASGTTTFDGAGGGYF